MATKWTDAYIRSLEPKGTRYDLREGNGFTVRVSPTGAKAFYYLFTLRGTKRRMYLGEYDPKANDSKGKEAQDHAEADPMPFRGLVSLKRARSRHTAALSLVRAGVDPVDKLEREAAKEAARQTAEEAQRTAEDLAPTVESLASDFVEKYGKARKRSWEEDERYLKQDVEPVLGKLKARDVTRNHIRALLRKKMDHGAPIAANRLLAVLRRMFGWAVDEGIIEENPCAGIKAPGKRVSKDRVLTPEEVRKVWAGLEPPAPRKKDDPPPEGPVVAMSPEIRRMLRLILVTAQRPGEVAGMKWEEIEGSWWTIPAERAKNGLSHRVHLSKLALEILGTGGEGYVFPSPRGGGHIHINAIAQAVRLNRKTLGAAPFTPHDLRRTAASLMAGAGVSPFTVERVLNHTLQGVQAVYNRHSYDNEKREALNRWAGQLGRILADKDEQKVVPIRGAR